MEADFFEEQAEQSRVKAEIVVNYFQAWAAIMVKRADRIAYVDLYAGPGRYKTGEKSTPLLILERAIDSPDLSQRLVSVFNDADPDHTKALEGEIASLPGIDGLKHQPRVYNEQVGEGWVKRFENLNTIPTLSFIDPWGYKGLSLRLIRAIIKDFGCESIFFFNYNRINMGIRNDLVEPHLEALFGPDRLADLRQRVAGSNPIERELLVRRALGDALGDMGGQFVIPFRFLRDDGRTSHYICFVSKHRRGYMIMKEVMATRGIVDADEVPLFEYLPSYGGRQLPFEISRPILALPADLQKRFEGQAMTVQDIIDTHNLGTPFTKKNYKKVLMEMEERGEVSCDPDRESRRKNTIGDRVLVSFPSHR